MHTHPHPSAHTWTFNARFLTGVLTCLVRPAGWRNPYTDLGGHRHG